MQMLVYYCATSYRRMKVINDLSKSSDLSAVKSLRSSTKDPCNVILNNETGDFYSFDPVSLPLSVG